MKDKLLGRGWGGRAAMLSVHFMLSYSNQGMLQDHGPSWPL